MRTYRELHLAEKVAASVKSSQLQSIANRLITANNSDHQKTSNDTDGMTVNVLVDGSTE